MTSGTATETQSVSRRVLDPVARNSEVLFGLIMVLTFTSSISAAEGDRSEIRTLLYGAIGCNLAWGIVDAVMYLMAELTERGRAIYMFRLVRKIDDPKKAHGIIAAAMPPKIAEALHAAELEQIRAHLTAEPDPPASPQFRKNDYLGAVAVFLLVFLSTFPVVVPFLVIRHDVKLAMRTSNGVAIVLLYFVGHRLGEYAGGRAWRWGFTMVLLGGALVAITIALGG
jgi:VIT family